MKFRIVVEKCNGCGACEYACPAAAIKIENNVARILDNCTDCGACAEVCAEKAIEKAGVEVTVDKYRNVCVVCELQNGRIGPVYEKLVALGKELAERTSEKTLLLLVGNQPNGTEKLASLLSSYDADEFYAMCALGEYHPEIYTKAIVDFVVAKKPKFCLFLATAHGNELAVRVGSKLDTAVMLNSVDVGVDEFDGNLLQKHFIVNGNFIGTYKLMRFPQIVSVQSNALHRFTGRAVEGGKSVEVQVFPVNISKEDYRIEKLERKSMEKLLLERGKIVIGVGRGAVKSYELLKELAPLLNATVGVSKGFVDSCAQAEPQIGVTGASIAPDLYIACGISGGFHHTYALRNAKVIVAINKDETAPIFKIADIGIVADVNEFIPAFIKYLKEMQTNIGTICK